MASYSSGRGGALTSAICPDRPPRGMESTDITNELKSLISNEIKPGQYMLSDSWTLEDTLPAIDIGNEKMDRGTVKIEGESLLDFVSLYFQELPGKQIDLSELLRNLFRLEMTWYTGKAFFSDTLLTCILLHRDPSVIISCTGNRLAALAVEATMTAASLISYLIASSPVIREEDFHANLYGMNWWASTYGGTHFPRFNFSNSEVTTQVNPGEMKLNLLLEQLAQVCRQDPKSFDRFYFARYYHWIKFLNDFIRTTSLNSNFASVYVLISELQSVLGDLEDDTLIPCGEGNIFPELANLFGYGCVRPIKPVLSLNAATRAWNRSLKDDLEGFVGGILVKRPRFHDLLRLLSERSRDPLKPPMLPVFRSILYASIVQSRFETIYQDVPRDQFISSSLPGVVCLVKLADLPLLMQDFVQVYCCSAARQRRFLPDLLAFWDEKILNLDPALLRERAGNRTVCWFEHFRDLLGLDLIILFGHLKLLSEDEELQASQLIFSIFEKFRMDGKEQVVPLRDYNTCKLDVIVKDSIRWQRRWSLISKGTTINNSSDVPQNVFNWLKTIVKLGRTAFSLSEPDWQQEIFATPSGGVSSKSTVGTVFTMYTTEPEEPVIDSEY